MVTTCDRTGATAGFGDCCAETVMASKDTKDRTPAMRIPGSIGPAPSHFVHPAHPAHPAHLVLDLLLVRSIIIDVNESLPKFSATERLIIELLVEHDELFGLQM